MTSVCWSTPKMPCRATFARSGPVETSGLTTYHATPARFTPSRVTAVSRAPQTLPFAYMTCCMRVSFESRREMTSLWAGSAPKRSLQQPVWPLNRGVVVSLMQWPCGVSVPGGVPEPGCFAFGAIPYPVTARTLFARTAAGVVVLSDDVFVSAHTTISLDVYVPPVPATGCVASSAAFELRKYSVPPAFTSNEAVPGDCAGHTVNPGWVGPASLATFTKPNVSMCCIVTVAAPAARCAFEKA